ncbi:MAG TPA: hypothetical protein VJV78_39155, partial [Polyangiales bacterium]|nr:hypothetical protein [Polyangiales bacterium]
MPRRATGTKPKWTKAGYAVARVRVHGRQESLRLPHCRTDAQAGDRAEQLAQLAQRMALAGTERADALEGLQRVARAPAGQSLRQACARVEKLIG